MIVYLGEVTEDAAQRLIQVEAGKARALFLEQKNIGLVEHPKLPAPLDDGMEVVGGIDDVALTDEENALVEMVVEKTMATSRQEYESKKLEISTKLAELEPPPEEETDE